MAKLKLVWKERDFDLCYEIQGNQAIKGALTRYGLLKFLENDVDEGG